MTSTGWKLSWKQVAGAVALTAIAAAMTGCGLEPGSVPTAISGTELHGSVHGGQQPIVGSTIQLYSMGATGYGSASTSQLTSTVLSQSDGSFSITGKYTCPSATAQVYLTATGGNPGVATNPNLAMMAALGPCGNLSSATFVYINEVTTVGSVWALSPFMTGPASIGTSAVNATGLANAVGDVATLVDTTQGVSPGPAAVAGVTVPNAEINALANALAGCINSAGGTAGDGSACGTLFNLTKVGSVAPTDTITAAMNIAQHPGANVSGIYNQSTGFVPFQPTLHAAPNDFTIAVNFTGGGLAAPSGLAADASGNLWVANGGNNTVTKLTPNGQPLSGSGFTGSLSTPSAIALDAAGQAWIANRGNNTVSRLSSSGTPVGSPLAGGGLNQPRSLSFDSLGNVWIANGGNASISEFSSSGTALSGTTGFTGSGVTTPVGIAVSPH